MSTKTIRVEKANNGLFYAKYDGGGQLPSSLGGMWTHENDLNARITAYLDNRKPQTVTQRRAVKAKKEEVDG